MAENELSVLTRAFQNVLARFRSDLSDMEMLADRMTQTDTIASAALGLSLDIIGTHSLAAYVPYRSQWDSDAAEFRGDCGPACVGMLLSWKMNHQPIDTLSVAAGMSATKKTTTADDLIRCARFYGLSLEPVRGWTLDQFAEHVPAIVLVHYGSIPCRMDTNYVSGHWLVVLNVAGRVTFHDPNWSYRRRIEGAHRSLSRAEFEKAMADCHLDGNSAGYGLVIAR